VGATGINVGATGINVDHVVVKEILSLCRDAPERLSFFMRVGGDVLDDDDDGEGVPKGGVGTVRKLPAVGELVVDTNV
jgi:hypothetical protein